MVTVIVMRDNDAGHWVHGPWTGLQWPGLSECPRLWLSSANLLGAERRTVQYYSIMSMSTQAKVCGQEVHLLYLFLSRRQ